MFLALCSISLKQRKKEKLTNFFKAFPRDILRKNSKRRRRREVLRTRSTGDQTAEAANAGRTLLMNHRRQFDPWTVSPTRQLAISLGLEKSGETERNRERERERRFPRPIWQTSGQQVASGNETPSRVGFDNKQELERAAQLSGYSAQLGSISLIYRRKSIRGNLTVN